MLNQAKIKQWLPCACKRLGDMMFAVSVALLLSVIVNQPTIVVHVIGHPAYLTSQPESLEWIVIKLLMALFCLCLGIYFDKTAKESVND